MAVYNSNPVPEESEDCLYLNVYAPAATKKGRAVLFWIYGGTLEFGTASLAAYDGSSFAANQDVVVVTINYRTNVFGFSSSPELPVHARNVGFLDQRLGLDWVQRNIEAFGGDPSKVTIFGESSGAASVDRLVVSPPHPVPFRGAITESGQASVSAAPRDTGPASWAFLVAALGCNNAADVLACVRKADALTIKGIVELNNLNFGPVTDNSTQLATPVNRSLHQSVPYMTGSNGQEGRILELGQTNLTSFTGTLFPESESLQQSIATKYAIGTPGITSSYDAIAQLDTEAVYQCPAAFVANESALAGFPTWRYYFNASFPNINPNAALAAAGAPGLDLQAYHSSEIRLVFGTYPVKGPTAQEIALSKVMQTAWASFAKDPMAGPGWASYGSKRGVNPLGLAALGTLGSDGVKMISPYDVDYRCALFTEIYAVVDTPAF